MPGEGTTHETLRGLNQLDELIEGYGDGACFSVVVSGTGRVGGAGCSAKAHARKACYFNSDHRGR